MAHSFWQENVRHWKRSVGLWCCLMVGVVSFAQSKPPRAELSLATASTTASPVALLARNSSSRSSSAVTLRYETMDLSALNVSAYGDVER